MLTVRFPDGTALEYNDARYVSWSSGFAHLYTDETKQVWVASVPATCVIESRRACRLYNQVKEPKALVQQTIEHLREMPVYYLAILKRELREFDATTKRWK